MGAVRADVRATDGIRGRCCEQGCVGRRNRASYSRAGPRGEGRVIRLFRHYIPRSFIARGLMEFLILVLAVYLGVWMRFMNDAAGRAEVEPIGLKALLFAAVMVFVMSGVGLYQRHFREGMVGTLLREGLSAQIGFAHKSFIFDS